MTARRRGTGKWRVVCPEGVDQETKVYAPDGTDVTSAIEEVTFKLRAGELARLTLKIAAAQADVVVVPEEVRRLEPVAPEVARAASVRLTPSDRLIVMTERHLRAEEADRLMREVSRWAPGVPVLLCPPGVDVAVAEGDGIPEGYVFGGSARERHPTMARLDPLPARGGR